MLLKTKNCFITALTGAALLFISITFSHAQSVTYGYDELNRLKSAGASGYIAEYTYDSAGNRLAVSEQVNLVPPTTIASPAEGLLNTTRSVTLTCYDASGAGCNRIYYTTNGAAPTTASSVYSSPISISTTTTLKYFATDNIGNSEAVKTGVYTIDAIPPTGTIVVNSGAASTPSAYVTLTLSCSDANGCTQMKFSNDGTTYTNPEDYATTKAWTLTVGDGYKYVYAMFKDTAGNWSWSNIAGSIRFDTVAPATTATPAGGAYNAAQSVTLYCGDAGSGYDKIYYTTHGATPTTSSTVYSSAISISTATTLKYFCKDRAGHIEAEKTQTYTFDTTPPTGSIVLNSGAQYVNIGVITLALPCTDTSGCTQMQFSNDNITWYSPVAYATSKAWGLSGNNGLKTVYVKFKDAAGNWSAAYNNSIFFDDIYPTTIATPVGGTYNTGQTVSLVCNDGSGSGCDKIYYTLDGTTPTTASAVYSTTIDIGMTKTLRYFSRDKAGNNEAVKTQTYRIQ